jgi:hypothetical protein
MLGLNVFVLLLMLRFYDTSVRLFVRIVLADWKRLWVALCAMHETRHHQGVRNRLAPQHASDKLASK